MDPNSTNQSNISTSKQNIRVHMHPNSTNQSNTLNIRVNNMDPNSTNQSNTYTISLNEKLRQLSSEQSEFSIYKVHKHLRSVSPTAYEPEVVAIGPYHRNKDHLKAMEHHKLRYLQLLLHHNKKKKAEDYISAIKEIESRARKCYAEHVSPGPEEFTDMLVLDGCFIIELVRKFDSKQLREKKDPIFEMDWIKNSLIRDLMLFENQIPLFVLCQLYDMIEAPNQRRRLTYLLMKFFKILCPGKVDIDFDADDKTKHLLHLIHRSWVPLRNPKLAGNNDTNNATSEKMHLLSWIHCNWFPCRKSDSTGNDTNNVTTEKKHLLSWIHCNWFPCRKSDPSGREKEKRLRFINSAMRLRDYNVKFKANDDKNLTLFDIDFYDGVMRMAPLTVEDRTESFFRNLIVYEQCFHQNQPNVVTDYVKFMDCLIDSPRDVEILSRSGVIENWLGDDEVVAKMVNKLTDSVAGPGDEFIYFEISEKVNKHCRKTNRWMAMLRRYYLNSPWGVLSAIAALFLLLLTATQTLFTIHKF